MASEKEVLPESKPEEAQQQEEVVEAATATIKQKKAKPAVASGAMLSS